MTIQNSILSYRYCLNMTNISLLHNYVLTVLNREASANNRQTEQGQTVIKY